MNHIFINNISIGHMKCVKILWESMIINLIGTGLIILIRILSEWG